jgi:hypothetical protein
VQIVEVRFPRHVATASDDLISQWVEVRPGHGCLPVRAARAAADGEPLRGLPRRARRKWPASCFALRLALDKKYCALPLAVNPCHANLRKPSPAAPGTSVGTGRETAATPLAQGSRTLRGLSDAFRQRESMLDKPRRVQALLSATGRQRHSPRRRDNSVVGPKWVQTLLLAGVLTAVRTRFWSRPLTMSRYSRRRSAHLLLSSPSLLLTSSAHSQPRWSGGGP